MNVVNPSVWTTFFAGQSCFVSRFLCTEKTLVKCCLIVRHCLTCPSFCLLQISSTTLPLWESHRGHLGKRTYRLAFFPTSHNVSARNKCLCSKLATRKWSRTVPGSVKAKQNGWLPKICPSYWILKLPMWWIDLGTTLRTWSTLCDITPISSLVT